MRIAYFVRDFPHSSETFIVNQIVGVAARGHVADIFTTSAGPNDTVPAAVEQYGLMRRRHRLIGSRNTLIGVLKLAGLMLIYGWRAPALVLRALNAARRGGPAGSLRLLYAALTFARLGTRRYDVIHAQFGTLGPLALKLIEIGAISGALVTSFRGYDAGEGVRRRFDAAYEELFRKGTLFLPVSRSLARRLANAGCDPSRIRVHHSGIECGTLQFMERNRRGHASTKIITIGRLVEKKGIRYSIEAIARALASGRSVQYTIVGDGPLRGELEQLVEDLGYRAHIAFTGWKPHDEAIRMINAAHILIAPSVTAAHGDEEGIPNVVKEAMAMGLPVVSTKHGGVPELVEGGKSGFLVPERDVDVLTERINYLIDHPETWPDMGRAGRRRIEAEFDIDELSDELVRLYASAARGIEGAWAQSPEALYPAKEKSGCRK